MITTQDVSTVARAGSYRSRGSARAHLAELTVLGGLLGVLSVELLLVVQLELFFPL